MHRFGYSQRLWMIVVAVFGLVVVGALVVSRAARSPEASTEERKPPGESTAEPTRSHAPELTSNPGLQEFGDRRPKAEAQPLALAEADEPAAAEAAVEKPSDELSEAPVPRRDRGGLTGVSRRYDDLECQLIQRRYSTPMPAAATILEIDGDRLPLLNPSMLALGRTSILFLPRGTHTVRFRPNESSTVVTINADFQTDYESMGNYFGRGPRIRTNELLSRGARAMDVYGTPFLLNFLGAHYVAQKQWDAAERTFRRALNVTPTFSPAHLNLCRCLLERQTREEAIREVNLADLFNIGNVFGLTHAIGETRRNLNLPIGQLQAAELPAGVYMAAEVLTEEDRRMVSLLQSLANYAVREEDRGKILNNLAVHFAESGKPELALYHFRGALAALKNAGPERFTLGREILSRMSDTCGKAGFVEADEYRAMSRLVSP